MRRLGWGIAAALALSGAAQASECGEQIKLLDDAWRLTILSAPERAPANPDQASSSGAGGSGGPSTTAGMDTVPNTGGIANPRNTPVTPLDADQERQVRAALTEAHRADQAGDATTCAAKVSEARRIGQARQTEPAAK